MITVLIDTGGRSRVSVSDLERGVRYACESLRVDDGEISLALLDDASIARLNEEYLGREGPTDVIAFALHDSGEDVVGDVYVGFDRAVVQARDLELDLGEELVRLAVHGTLHVLGLDHPIAEQERESSDMFQLQERLVRAVFSNLGEPG